MHYAQLDGFFNIIKENYIFCIFEFKNVKKRVFFKYEGIMFIEKNRYEIFWRNQVNGFKQIEE